MSLSPYYCQSYTKLCVYFVYQAVNSLWIFVLLPVSFYISLLFFKISFAFSNLEDGKEHSHLSSVFPPPTHKWFVPMCHTLKMTLFLFKFFLQNNHISFMSFSFCTPLMEIPTTVFITEILCQ